MNLPKIQLVPPAFALQTHANRHEIFIHHHIDDYNRFNNLQATTNIKLLTLQTITRGHAAKLMQPDPLMHRLLSFATTPLICSFQIGVFHFDNLFMYFCCVCRFYSGSMFEFVY